MVIRGGAGISWFFVITDPSACMMDMGQSQGPNYSNQPCRSGSRLGFRDAKSLISTSLLEKNG